MSARNEQIFFIITVYKKQNTSLRISFRLRSSNFLSSYICKTYRCIKTMMNSLIIILSLVLAVETCSAFTPSTNNVHRATHLNVVKFDKETQKWFTDDPEEMEGSSYVSFVIWLWYYAYHCSYFLLISYVSIDIAITTIVAIILQQQQKHRDLLEVCTELGRNLSSLDYLIQKHMIRQY